jgi:hypothetical protein
VLRGEVDEVVQDNLDYLTIIRRHVERVIDRRFSIEALDEITIEICGKSRIPLNGLVQELHRANLYALYHELQMQRARMDTAPKTVV